MTKLKAPKLTFDQAIVMLPKEFQPVERASYHRHKLRANSTMDTSNISMWQTVVI